MTDLEIWLIAFSLAMDCLAISIASGILMKKFFWRPMLTMAVAFGLFQGCMPIFGWVGTCSFNAYLQHIDHWVAFVVLGILGGSMIYESIKPDKKLVKFDPKKLTVILTLAIATSIDAFAVGISFACLGICSISQLSYTLGVIGFVSFVLSLVGLVCGIHFGNTIRNKLHPGIVGGVILIAIGTKILIEHLFFQ